MKALYFDEAAINGMRERVATPGFAAEALGRIASRLEPDRDSLLRTGRPECGNNGLGVCFMHLAICSRLLDSWHREAAEMLLRFVKDHSPFVFKQNHDLCLGLDFIPDLDPSLQTHVIDDLLVPLGERVLAEHRGGSNHQTTRNLTLLKIGLLADRDDFINVVTSDPQRSFAYHLTESVFPDGLWYEQSPGSYHVGTLERFLRTRWVADRHGIALGGDDVIQKMLDALPGISLPGGVLPRIGDVGEAEASRSAFERLSLLEPAYAMFRTPWVGWALSRTRRNDVWSLLVGEPVSDTHASEEQRPDATSRLFPQTGLCVLKHGDADTYWRGKGAGATITFGPHGDWHGHAGKLGIEYAHDGRFLVRDHGNSQGYAHPIHRLWFTSSLAHSTVVVDQRNQAFTWSRDKPQRERDETGTCLASLFRDDVSACTVAADFAFPGCSLKRTIFLTPRYLLDITECRSLDGEAHCFDWLMHTSGTLQSTLPFKHDTLTCLNKGVVPSPPDRSYSPGALAPASYDFIREIESASTAHRWSIDVMDATWVSDAWNITGKAMRLTMLGQTGTTIFKGVCPAAQRDVYDPVVMVRRRAHQSTFVALYVPGGDDLSLECPVNNDSAIVCCVDGSDILVKQDRNQPLTYAGRTLTGQLACAFGPA